MGWCSGTKVFDALCDVMFDPDKTEFEEILADFIETLEDMDWDCQQGSRHWKNPVVQKVMKILHPDWFEDERG